MRINSKEHVAMSAPCPRVSTLERLRQRWGNRVEWSHFLSYEPNLLVTYYDKTVWVCFRETATEFVAEIATNPDRCHPEHIGNYCEMVDDVIDTAKNNHQHPVIITGRAADEPDGEFCAHMVGKNFKRRYKEKQVTWTQETVHSYGMGMSL